jgi:hypothetical protein
MFLHEVYSELNVIYFFIKKGIAGWGGGSSPKVSIFFLIKRGLTPKYHLTVEINKDNSFYVRINVIIS